jgi:hypothetical protein
MALFAEVITPAMAATNLITSIGSIVSPPSITNGLARDRLMIEYGKQLPAEMSVARVGDLSW